MSYLKFVSQVVCVASLASFALPSKADSIYDYRGNAYNTFPVTSAYTSANFISATLDTASPLLPDQSYAWGAGGIGTPTATDTLISFSESDGSVAYSAAGGINIFVTTNSSGQIATWFVGACGPCTSSSINVDSQFGLPSPFATAGLDGSTLGSGGIIQAYVAGAPGTWRQSNTGVPEPATLGLLGFGLAAAALAQRKRKG